MNPFKKGDRIKYKKAWSCPSNFGTVVSVDGSKVQWHVDGYSYSSGDYHEHEWDQFDSIGSRATTNICHCKNCNAPNPWAVPNQPDNSYICYECR